MKNINKKGCAVITTIAILCAGISGGAGVSAAKASPILNKKSITISVKKNYQLKVKKASLKKMKKKLVWKSSNKKVAVVNKKGKVTGKKAGTAKITVKGTLKSGKKISAICNVTVKDENVTATKTPEITGSPAATATIIPTAAPSTVPSSSLPPQSSAAPSIQPTPAASSSVIQSKAIKGKLVKYQMPQQDAQGNDLMKKFELRQAIQEAPVITTYSQLLDVVDRLKAKEDSDDNLIGFIQTLESYGEDFFVDNNLCFGCVETPYEYEIAVKDIQMEKLSDGASNIKIELEANKDDTPDIADLCVMKYHICLVEVTKEDANEAVSSEFLLQRKDSAAEGDWVDYPEDESQI